MALNMQVFESLDALFDTVTNHCPMDNDERSSHKEVDPDDYGWDFYGGTHTFEEAQALAVEGGWSEGGSEATEAVGRVLERVRESGLVTRPRRMFTTAGARPFVPLAAAGNPACYVRHRPEPRDSIKGRTVRVVVNVSMTANVSTYAAIKRGITYAALVEVLQSMGLSVEVWCATATAKSKSPGGVDAKARACAAWRVKPAGAPLDRERLLFSMAHPSTHRRIGFSIRECADATTRNVLNVAQHGTYGKSVKLPKELRDRLEADVYADAPMQGQMTREVSDPVRYVLDTLEGLGLVGG
jgi:hypothetical protein